MQGPGERQPFEPGPASPRRGYRGLRITPPPRTGSSAAEQEQNAVTIDGIEFPRPQIDAGSQARILTGASLFGVILIVLLHEFGHWISGLAVTGEVPRFYVVAVEQKVADFSTASGIITWGAGPAVHLAVLWGLVLAARRRGRRSPRLVAAAGGALMFTILVHLFIWGAAALTSTDSWGNDLPRVATFLGSKARLWMHVMSAAFILAVLAAGYRWLLTVLATGKPGLHISPTIIGTVEGTVMVLIGTVFVSLI